MGFETPNWIDGKPAATGEWIDNVNPATGEVQGAVASSGEADVDRAVASAASAFPEWSAKPVRERGSILRRWAELVRARQERFAELESMDTGKPLALARELDIPRAIHNLEFFADAATQWTSEAVATEAGEQHVVHRSPLGAVACISPWNLPLYLLTWKIAPALAAGNTVVAKPSEITPLTAQALAELSVEAGLPPGVFNVVQGLGSRVGPRLTGHPDIGAVSFTGSTATGRAIASVTGTRFKKTSLEMGGKNAAIVFQDADLERAIPALVRGAFRNQGQICLCMSRVLVHEKVYERVREALIAETRRLRVGDPLEAGTDQGALVSQAQFEKVLGFLAEARRLGGKFMTGGHAVTVPGRCQGGFFVVPTWIEGLEPGCAVNQEEIFGPVATLQPFGDEDEAIRIANGTRYGLAASVWTRDIDRAQRAIRALKSGLVWVNSWMSRDLRTPFGGFRESGLGREGGLEAMRFFTEPKTVSTVYR